MAQPTLLAAEAATTSPIFYLFTSLPHELQLHVFSFVLDWLIAETRGRDSHRSEGYTKIRQLLYEFGLNPLLRTNRLVRILTLTAWKLELLRLGNGELKSKRDERRVEKALCLIELLGDTELHLSGIRLLLTSNATWNQIKAQLHILNAEQTPGERLHGNISASRHLSAASIEIEVWLLTCAEYGDCDCPRTWHDCQNENRSGRKLEMRSYGYFGYPELAHPDSQHAFSFRSECQPPDRCTTTEEFESMWVRKVSKILDS